MEKKVVKGKKILIDEFYRKRARRILARLKKLRKEKKYIEAVLLLSSIIESLLWKVVRVHEEEINPNRRRWTLLPIIDKNTYSFKRDPLKVLEEYFSKNIGYKDLVKIIKKFRTVRNKCAHDLLNVDISYLERNIEKNFSKFLSIPEKLLEILMEFLRIKLKRLELLSSVVRELELGNKRRIDIPMVNGEPDINQILPVDLSE